MENETIVRNECEKMLSDVLCKHDIMPAQDMMKQFYVYYQFLIEYNQKVNLTAITDIKEVYYKHFADCVVGAKYLKFGATVCDIGTGAGFPGVVLKIIRPDIKLTLVDSLNKRVEFLNQLLVQLKIEGVKVLHNRAEDIDLKNKYLNSFDYVVSRAVAKLNILCEYCLPYVRLHGQFIAYKSEKTDEELREAEFAIKILGGKISDVKNVDLFKDASRKLVLIDKIQTTSNKYPRGQNKPRKSPLI